MTYVAMMLDGTLKVPPNSPNSYLLLNFSFFPLWVVPLKSFLS